jgi:hypothetical protein
MMGCKECERLENQVAVASRHEQEVGREVVADRAAGRPIFQGREAVENLSFAMSEARETTKHWRIMLDEHRKTHPGGD